MGLGISLFNKIRLADIAKTNKILHLFICRYLKLIELKFLVVRVRVRVRVRVKPEGGVFSIKNIKIIHPSSGGVDYK